MEKEDIELSQFIEKFEENFEHPMPKGFSPSTRFRNLSEWSSLQALVVVSSFEENYGVLLSSLELENSETVQDLFSIVRRKIQT